MRIRRRALVASLVAGLGWFMPLTADAVVGAPDCRDRVLIVAAMPLELNPLVAATRVDATVVARPIGQAPRTFYVGDLDGTPVALAMSGIGMVNAEQTTQAAFARLGSCFRAALFSGVAGGIYNIGDVAIAADWTVAGGPNATPVDPAMLGVARALEAPGAVPLAQKVPVGDAACLCPGVDAATPVAMPQPLAVHVGGRGTTNDTFGGHAVPCVPGGGDITGCKPCVTQPGFGSDAKAFAKDAPPLFTPGFFLGLFRFESTTDEYVSQDEETALVARVAAAHGVPFLGVRAVSDGANDPLHLPGFPWQFATYRQLAGNNAAAVTIAFLHVWAAAGYPTTA